MKHTLRDETIEVLNSMIGLVTYSDETENLYAAELKRANKLLAFLKANKDLATNSQQGA